MVSAGSTSALEADRAYELDPQVGLRREGFGALLYHYRTRRLLFLRSTELIEVLIALPSYPCLRAALEVAGDTALEQARLLGALQSLYDAEVIRAC
jgi:putative mycofactocin binding protein MftB